MKMLTQRDVQILECFLADSGTFFVTANEFGYQAQTNSQRFVFDFTSDDQWCYEENLGLVDTAYIIGSGHVGLALSRQLAMMGFRVIAFDQRPDVESFVDNTFAQEKHVVQYKSIADHIPEGDFSFVIIMTHAHNLDQIVLQQLIAKNLRYLGMLGSKTKVKTIFDNLIQTGVPSEQLERVYAPIGLKIHSKTADEIAVSIAAQMIQVRNSMNSEQ